MSNDTLEKQEKELEDMKQQLEQAAEAEKEKAAKEETPEPSPDPTPSPAPEAVPSEPTPVTPSESKPEKAEDDPMEWAKKKGLKTPEDMARLLRQKEQEFHQSRQQKGGQEPPPPQWQPRPDMGWQQPYPSYGNAPPLQRGDAYRDIAAMYPQLDPEDVRRVLPLVIDAAETIANRKIATLDQRFGYIEQTAQRNNELMTLMQDPAFTDVRVQKEIHSILDADPSIFQREPLRAQTIVFKQAMENLARKQLQQGTTVGSLAPMPPVTAGGGNGSAYTGPRKITQKEFESWSIEDQKAFINSNGKRIPKK